MDKSNIKKVGPSTFDVAAVKSMKLKGFKEVYSKHKVFEGVDLEALYNEITGSGGNVG